MICNTDLGKWPLLVVKGDPVTREQANDILIRTNSWWHFFTNDKGWGRKVADIVGFPIEPDYYAIDDMDKRMPMIKAYMAEMEAFRKEIGVLDLEYMHNARIASAWIGGPNGWCNWDGTIFTDDYNIGKWPGDDEIEQEWRSIAEAFPYLNARVQLFPDEGAVLTPAVELVLSEGTLSVIENPTESLRDDPSAPDRVLNDFVGWLQGPRWSDREIGVTPERLAEAIEQVRASR